MHVAIEDLSMGDPEIISVYFNSITTIVHIHNADYREI